MSGNEINRRDFLKFMGLGGVGAATLSGCDMPTTVTLEEGKEKVQSYLVPEEYVIPGIGVYFASTCQQCAAGCGLHGRVREGRVLKVEGNPDSAVSYGGLCQMGQAGLQGHYNPDRLSKPMVRKGGKLTETTWQEAWAEVEKKLAPAGGVAGDKVAWFTGTVSGHQAVLLGALQQALGSNSHYVFEVVNNAVGEAVNQAVLGEAQPLYRFDEAKAILSFGADFLGTWVSPVHFARQYAAFRSGDRGVLIQVEPKMTLTGANADLWVAARPGSEGAVALGIANVLITKHQVDAGVLPQAVRDVIAGYGVEKVTRLSGVSGDALMRIAGYLKERSPSLVLAGASAQGHADGYQAAMTAMVLNILLGNVGKTIQSAGAFPLPQLQPKLGGTAALPAFVEALEQGRHEVVFFHGANPVYSAPAALKLADKLAKVPFKVALSMFPDETTLAADVVLPLASPYEDWGTHVAAYRTANPAVQMQQPLMQPLYPDGTKGFGDILLALLKLRGVQQYAAYEDYYAYLQSALAAMPATLKEGKADVAFWNAALQKGVIPAGTAGGALKVTLGELAPAAPAGDGMYLVPSARLGLWDGRHANIPWLQEAPDQISKVYWSSWAELHPSTAAKLGVKEGDYIRVESDQGAIEAQVYIYKGVHPDVVAVPMGQGHEEYGRYAKGRGVNPLKVLSPIKEAKTGELALYATRVRVSKTGKSEQMPRLGGSERQMGRRIVGTVKADVFRKTEGGGNVA